MLAKEQMTALIDKHFGGQPRDVFVDELEALMQDAVKTYGETELKTTLECVQAVIDLAIARDEVVTIRLVSDFPPRMGAYLMVPDVRAVVRKPVETHADTERWHDGVRPVTTVKVKGLDDDQPNAMARRHLIPEFTPEVPEGVYVTHVEDGDYHWSDNIKRTRKA